VTYSKGYRRFSYSVQPNFKQGLLAMRNKLIKRSRLQIPLIHHSFANYALPDKRPMVDIMRPAADPSARWEKNSSVLQQVQAFKS
jgi:hypothetical protein